MIRPSNEPREISLARALAHARRRAQFRDQTIAEIAALGITQIEQHLKEVVR